MSNQMHVHWLPGQRPPSLCPQGWVSQVGWGGAWENGCMDKGPWSEPKMLSEPLSGFLFFLFFSVSVPTLELSSLSECLAHSQGSFALHRCQRPPGQTEAPGGRGGDIPLQQCSIVPAVSPSAQLPAARASKAFRHENDVIQFMFLKDHSHLYFLFLCILFLLSKQFFN